jgi:hypothetical protein
MTSANQHSTLHAAHSKGAHTDGFPTSVSQFQHQATAAINDPSGHLVFLLIALSVAVLVAYKLLAIIGTAMVSTAASSTGGNSASGDISSWASAGAKLSIFIACLALPSIAFGHYFDHARTAVSTILGG